MARIKLTQYNEILSEMRFQYATKSLILSHCV